MQTNIIASDGNRLGFYNWPLQVIALSKHIDHRLQSDKPGDEYE